MAKKKLIDYELADLYDWIEAGQPADVPSEFADYVNVLDKIRGMLNRIDKYGSNEVIVRHLITFEPELKGKRIKAMELINESIEYFYANKTLSKKAWCLWYATQLEKAYNFAIATAKNPSEAEKASKILERAGKFREMAESTELKLPDEIFKKPYKIYTMDLNLFDKPNVDREEIDLWLEENFKELPQKALDTIKEEAMLKPIRLFKDEAEDPRKS